MFGCAEKDKKIPARDFPKKNSCMENLSSLLDLIKLLKLRGLNAMFHVYRNFLTWNFQAGMYKYFSSHVCFLSELAGKKRSQVNTCVLLL